MITQTFNLNLIPESSPVVIHCDQYDKGTGRLIVKLYDGDVAYTPTGTAVIQGTKPDGKGFTYSATLSGNTVTADLTEQMSAVAGRVRCQIVVTESTGRTGTFVFILDVQRSALPANTDLSDSDYQLIEQAIQDAQDAVEDAEAWAVGERGGIPVGPTDPTYENNSYFWCLQASQYASGGLIFQGSIPFASIPTVGMQNGDMYNITEDFTTDVRFVEGAGVQCAAGTNIAWIDSLNLWDVLASSKIGSINDLNDVTITTPSNGQFLKYSSGDWVNGSAGNIDDLADVSISSPSDGQVLKYDGNSGEWINGSGGGASDLDDLTDVTISSPTDGQYLKYDSNSSKWVNASGGGGGASALNDLTDVTISTPSDGQALLYDANSGEWINGTVSGGGGMNTDGSNASSSVSMTGTKVFTIGDRTGKSSAGEYAFELGDGGNATGYGAYAEGVKDYSSGGASYGLTLNANTTIETLKSTTISLTTYPYLCFGFTNNLTNPANWEATVAGGLDNDITLTSGDATVRLHQNDTVVEIWYTNTGGTNVLFYYDRATQQNVASGDFSHAEGSHVTASGRNSHAEGFNTTASSSFSHAEGYRSTASGLRSHAEGCYTYASSSDQHVSGKYNVADGQGVYAVIVGNGTAHNVRSNALTLDWTGELETAGDIINGNGVSIDMLNTVTNVEVDLTSWTADTTSQSGSTLYRKQVTLNHVYTDTVSVDIGAGTGYTLPTLAEQASYDLIEYVTVDSANTCLYIYASAVPTTAFYINVTGID